MYRFGAERVKANETGNGIQVKQVKGEYKVNLVTGSDRGRSIELNGKEERKRNRREENRERGKEDKLIKKRERVGAYSRTGRGIR